MTREDAKRYWTAKYEAASKWDDPHWEASERKEHRRYVDALKAAIEALSAEAKDDLVSRQWLLDLYETPKDGDGVDWKVTLEVVRQNIKDAPSADAEQTDCTDFVNWLLEEIMDEENWEYNAVANGEIIARKLKKLGLLEVKDGYYIRHIKNNTKESDLVYRPSAEAVQGEWTNAGVLTVHCSNCKSEFHELEAMNFCPNCGAKMKGEEDD